MTSGTKSCCSPSRTEGRELNRASEATPFSAAASGQFERVNIPGGTASRGTDTQEIPEDEEGPLKQQKIRSFQLARTAITNAQFAKFVDETGYVTEAEKWGWSFVFHLQVPRQLGHTQGISGLEWWRRVEGANWRDVIGPGSAESHCYDDHPVVHVSWNDAAACAAWAGGRLPTEAEWEHAARGGLGDVRFPWGDREPDDTGFTPCNIWQGNFPHQNTALDGYLATAPAECYDPNGYGLYNMSGNTWEWLADPLRLKSLKRATRERMKAQKGWKLLKGGSFLCHRSYCYRYRIAARSSNSAESTTSHMGFRIAWDV